jgi:hypothetical protein
MLLVDLSHERPSVDPARPHESRRAGIQPPWSSQRARTGQPARSYAIHARPQALHLSSAYGKGDLSEDEAFSKARKIKKEQLLFHSALSSGLCLLTSLFLLCSPFCIAWIFFSAFLENADHDLPSERLMINEYSTPRVLICSPS